MAFLFFYGYVSFRILPSYDWLVGPQSPLVVLSPLRVGTHAMVDTNLCIPAILVGLFKVCVFDSVLIVILMEFLKFCGDLYFEYFLVRFTGKLPGKITIVPIVKSNFVSCRAAMAFTMKLFLLQT